jgi:hypothetical protein
MLASDLVGFVGSLFLLVPAAKDRLYRFKTDQQTRKNAQSPWPGVRKAIASAWRVRWEAMTTGTASAYCSGRWGFSRLSS